MRKLLKSGFTLVESTVAMAVFMIAVVSASGLMMMAGNLFAKNAETDRAVQVGEKLCGLLRDKLSCAVSLDISTTENYDLITVSGEYTERLIISAEGNSVGIARGNFDIQTIIDEADLKGLRADVSIDIPDEKTPLAQAEVKLYDGENCLFSKSFGIPLLNMNAENAEDYTGESFDEDNCPLVISYGYLQ